METERAGEKRTENSEEVGTENSKKMKRKLKKKNIPDTITTGSGTAKPKAGPAVDVLESARKTYCLILHNSCSDLGDEDELETGCVLTEKLSLILTSLPYNAGSERKKLCS